MSSFYEELFSHLTWDYVLDEAGVRDKSCLSKLDEKIETLVQNNLRLKKFFFSSCGFDDEDTQRIIDKLEEYIINAPLVKRRRIEGFCPSPSTLGDPSQWKPGSSADKAGVIKCIQNHRVYFSTTSGMKVHGVPVTLLVKEFGVFTDLLKSELSAYSHEYVPLAVELMWEMSKIFPNEDERVHSLLTVLNKEFQIQKISKHKSFSTDLSIISNNEAVGNVEVKNELGLGGKAPNLQQCGYAIKLKSGEKSHSPVLLLTVAGCEYFQVSGAAWNGRNLCCDPLTEPISLLYTPHFCEDAIKKVACTLYAMSKTVVALGERTELEISDEPYYSYNEQVSYRGKLQNNLWKAQLTTADGTVDVLVKFVKRYGERVHRLLSEKNMAPKIYALDELPGGWTVVIMEEVKGRLLCNADVPTSVIKDFAEELYKVLCDNGFVHGDLRPQNIMYSSDKKCFSVLDFDWAGNNGVVMYPANINTERDWHPDVRGCVSIKYLHDRYQLDKLHEVS